MHIAVSGRAADAGHEVAAVDPGVPRSSGILVAGEALRRAVQV